MTRNIWSRWQSHFGLCGLAICGTASTCVAVPQIEDNKTNGKQSDVQDVQMVMAQIDWVIC